MQNFGKIITTKYANFACFFMPESSNFYFFIFLVCSLILNMKHIPNINLISLGKWVHYLMKQISSDIEANKPMNYGEENLIIH